MDRHFVVRRLLVVVLGVSGVAKAQGQEAAGAPVQPENTAPAPAVPSAQAQPSQETPAAPGGAAPDASLSAKAEDEQLKARIDEIDQRSRIAERRLDLADEAAEKAKTAPVIAAGDKGFSISSSDKAYQLRVRGVVQGDSRFYLNDDALSQQDKFVIRKLRANFDGTLAGIADFRLLLEMATPAAPILDAYGDFRPWAWLKLRVGKFKSPVSLERLQGDAVVKFPERGFPASVAPNRDIGVQLHGDILEGVINYALAVMNGSPDGGNLDTDTNHAKDFIGRLFFQPWKQDQFSRSVLYGLGFGVAASTGNQKGTPTSQGLSGYQTAGLQSFFSYLPPDTKDPSNTVIARKRRDRLCPQLYYYYGPFGLLAEYIVSRHTVEKKGEQAKLSHRAWLVEASYVLTGDANSYDGVQVKNAFDPSKGTWGAVELSLRYNELRLDEDTFPAYADPLTAARNARAFGAALVWNWSRNLSWQVSGEQTRFEGGAVEDGDRRTETVVFTRAQVAF